MTSHRPAPPARQGDDLFLSLGPEAVLAAVEAAGLRTRPVCYPLNSFENRVYEVELEDRSRIVAKFYRPGRWSEAQILEEHAFLAELQAEELPVCPVLPFPDGSTLRRSGHIFYGLFERRGGRAPDELDPTLARRAGLLTARLHDVGARHAAPHRLVLEPDGYARRDVDWLERQGSLPPSVERRYLETARAIADHAELALRGAATQRLHGDLHHGNLLLRDGALQVLDFDDMMTGPPVQDVWLLFPGRDLETRRLRDAFLDGYEQLRAFDHASLRLVEPLRGLRLVHYAVWLARRFDDPAFRLGWPHFGTADWWRRETEDLEDELRVIEGEAPRQATAIETSSRREPEVLLDNKDYFFDWEG